MAAVLLGGCKPISFLSVDLSSPGSEELPDSVQTLLLLDRAVDHRFTDDPSDTIQLRFFERQFTVDTILYDLAASDTLIRTLGHLLYESGRYDVIIPIDRFPMKDSFNLYSDSMSWEEVERLTSLYQTDAILSLDYHKTEVSTGVEREAYADWENASTNYIYGAGMKVAYIAQFRVYDPRNREVVRSHFLVDTLYWNDRDLELKALFRRFTYVKPALVESGIAAALRLSERIAPRWVTSRRALFLKGHPVLRAAAPLAMEYRMEEALAAWSAAEATATSKSLKSKLLFNMAVAYEMRGDLNEAIRLGVKSYETMYRQVTHNYLITLGNRRALLQPPRNNDVPPSSNP